MFPSSFEMKEDAIKASQQNELYHLLFRSWEGNVSNADICLRETSDTTFVLSEDCHYLVTAPPHSSGITEDRSSSCCFKDSEKAKLPRARKGLMLFNQN